MSERLTMTVEMRVTPAQALALHSMFLYWNRLSGIGSSRDVGFHVDGDGNFHPKCKISFSDNLPKLTDEMQRKAVVHEHDGDRTYDFDSIAWGLH